MEYLAHYDYLSNNYERDLYDIVIIVIAEHIVFGIKFVLSEFIDDCPDWVSSNEMTELANLRDLGK